MVAIRKNLVGQKLTFTWTLATILARIEARVKTQKGYSLNNSFYMKKVGHFLWTKKFMLQFSKLDVDTRKDDDASPISS